MTSETSLPVSQRITPQFPANTNSTSHQATRADLPRNPERTVQDQSKHPISSPLIAQEISRAVDIIMELAVDIDRNLQFHVDEITGKTVVTVRDKQTDEVIRQIPNEEMLSMAQRLRQGGGLLEELTG
ncbi:MAG: flagellar protein FlaG [Gammaproteobacteria bacterium]